MSFGRWLIPYYLLRALKAAGFLWQDPNSLWVISGGGGGAAVALIDLEGAKPADVTVEQPRKFEFIINLRTAKQIGLTIRPNVWLEPTK